MFPWGSNWHEMSEDFLFVFCKQPWRIHFQWVDMWTGEIAQFGVLHIPPYAVLWWSQRGHATIAPSGLTKNNVYILHFGI